MKPLPVWAHEWLLAPAAFLLACIHARRAFGARRAALEMAVLAGYGFGLELVTLRLFRAHDYGNAWSVAPLGVPVAVALVWAAIILSALAVSARTSWDSDWGRAAGAALLATSLDVSMEPVAVRLGLWRWNPPADWLGVPIGNFVGWGVIVGAYCLGLERCRHAATPSGRAAARGLLLAGSLLALVCVGLAWQGLHLERFFAGRLAWLCCFGLLLATLLGALRQRAALLPSGIAGELAAPGGPLPSATLGLLALGFGWDALALDDPALIGVVLGTSLALAPWLWKVQSPRGERIDAWRLRAFGRLTPTDGLVHVLMKPRNGLPWTAEDRLFLRQQLRAMAGWTPGLLLFLLPGGLFLLAGYAWLLDRRRTRRWPS